MEDTRQDEKPDLFTSQVCVSWPDRTWYTVVFVSNEEYSSVTRTVVDRWILRVFSEENFLLFFSVHVQSDSKGREEQDCFGRILNAAGGGSRDLERDFRLQVWSNLKGFAVALFDFRSMVRKRIFEDFFSIVEESLLFVFNIYTCVYIGTWDVVIYWYLNIVEIIIVYMVI